MRIACATVKLLEFEMRMRTSSAVIGL